MIRPRAHIYSINLIHLCILLVTKAAVSFRGVSAIFEILAAFFPQIKKVPSFTTVRQWIIRYGLFKLNMFREKAHDWALVIDHTIQIGQLKTLVILGLPLSYLPINRALSLSDMEPLLVLPMKSSTGSRVNQALESIQEKYGTIRLIVADQGTDIKAGIKKFKCINPSVDYIPDIVHTLAHLLNSELSDNISWQLLNEKTSVLRKKLLQSQFAHHIPPLKRDKARYLNLEELIKWAMRILASFDCLKISEIEREAIKNSFFWIAEIKADIEFFDELWRIIAITRDLIRTKGITSNTPDELVDLLTNLSLSKKALEFSSKVLNFILEQSSKAKSDERLLGSSEIIESLFGTLKQRLNSQSRSGFTVSVLMASTLVGEVSTVMVHEAMETISTNEVLEWSKAFVGESIQKKRRIFQKLTRNSLRVNKPEDGTENGNISIEELLLATG